MLENYPKIGTWFQNYPYDVKTGQSFIDVKSLQKQSFFETGGLPNNLNPEQMNSSLESSFQVPIVVLLNISATLSTGNTLRV